MFLLRRRSDADLATLVGWVPDAAALYLFTGPRLQWPLTAKQLADMEQIDGMTAWVLVDSASSSPVGFFDLIVKHRLARLGRVIIDPQRRGQGLGHALVRFAIRQARQLGATELTLNVIIGNDPAIRAYERTGFRSVPNAERPDVQAMSLML